MVGLHSIFKGGLEVGPGVANPPANPPPSSRAGLIFTISTEDNGLSPPKITKITQITKIMKKQSTDLLLL